MGTPFSMAPLSFTNPVTSAAAAAATVATMLPSLVPSDPKDMFVSTKSQPPIVHAPSPTPSSSSGSGLPVLKFIEDESLFDLDALTCHACNKSFKNTRAFKLHRDRHQGALKHKCPECIKTFNGRSEVNRHMVAIHGRPLQNGEDTLHKKADQAQKAAKLFDSAPINVNTTISSEADINIGNINFLNTPTKLTSPMMEILMMMTSTPQNQMLQNPMTSTFPMMTTATNSMPALSTTLDLNPTVSTISTIASGLILTSTPVQSVPPPLPATMEKMYPDRISLPMLDMPSLLDPEPVKEKPIEVEDENDLTLMDGPCELDPITGKLKRIEEPEPSVDDTTIEPEPKPESKAENKTEPRKLESVKKLPVESVKKLPAQSKHGPGDVKVIEKSAPARGMPSLEPTKAPSPIKDSNDLEFDALIAPKPVVVKPAEKIDATKVKETSASDNKKISDEKVMSVKGTSPKAQEMIEDTAEVASKAIESEIMIEESDKPDIENPTVKESKEKSRKETKEKLDKEPKEKPKKEPKEKKVLEETKDETRQETKDKPSEEVKEDSIDESKEEEEEILPRRRGRSQRSTGVPSWKKEKRKEKSPKRDLNSESPKPKQKEKSPEKITEETDAPKKRRGRPKRQPEPSTSEDSSQEKEKENSTTEPTSKEVEKPTTPVVKTPKLLKQKGVSINKAGQVMIPSHKITLPEELCLIVENKKGKKKFISAKSAQRSSIAKTSL